MVARTALSLQAIARHVRAYRIGSLVAARAISNRGAHTLYDVTTTQGQFTLRILEDRPRSDARFEEVLLARLRERDLPVPSMLEAGRRGRVLPLGPRRHLSLFLPTLGREVAVFEISAAHATQVGEFLASMHLAVRGLRRRRRNGKAPARARRVLEASLAATPDEVQRRDLHLCLEDLGDREWEDDLPTGAIHGHLGVDKARFQNGRLCGALGFDGACTGALAYDLAAAVVDWAFLHDRLVIAHAIALVAGYERLRPLRAREREALYALCCFVAAQRAVRWHYEHEVRNRVGTTTSYRDYRHFVARLLSLRQLGETAFTRAAFGVRRCGLARAQPGSCDLPSAW
ncbi:MAG: phosphotransferase [Myxococcota bacterium]